MTKNDSPADSTPSLAAQIDRLCDQFEAAWRNNQTPRIEDYLADWMSKDHAGLIRKLLRTELEIRRKSGDQPTAEEYLQRFADHAKVVHAVFAEYEATGKVQETIDFPGKQLDRNATSQSTLSHGDAVTLPPTGQLTPFVGNDLHGFGDYETGNLETGNFDTVRVSMSMEPRFAEIDSCDILNSVSWSSSPEKCGCASLAKVTIE